MYDIIGAALDDLDELAGDAIGLDTIIGGVKFSASEVRGLQKARAIDPNAVATVRQKQDQRRRKVLPVPATSVAAGASAVVTIETQETYRPERLIVASAIAGSFLITDIVVGTRSQFSTPGDCPSEIFSPDAVDANVHFDTLNVGAKMTMRITNFSAVLAVFRAAFLGTSLS